MTSRLFRGGDKGGAAADFDPVTQGQRHGLAADIARELWDGITREATGPDGRVDQQRARERFEEVARRVASRRTQGRPTPGKGSGTDGTHDRRALGAAHAALAPGKVTLVETEAHDVVAPVLPDLDGVPALLASGAPTARSAPAPASRKGGSSRAATSGASTGKGVAALDVEALERRAVMLGVLPFVTPRWKQLGGALFSSDEKPAAPLSPEAFAARA